MDSQRRKLLVKGLVGSGLMGGAALTASAQTKTQLDGPSVPRDPDESINLWPGSHDDPGMAPGLLSPNLEESVAAGGKDPNVRTRKLRGITHPRIAVFRPEHPTGAAMLIAPGGGYTYLAIDNEGYEIASWLNMHGITAFVLIYRLPSEGWRSAADTPLIDAQRALRLIRSSSERNRVDPSRVGMMGFSAGGHVAASLATRFDARVYEPIDAVDQKSARPDIVAALYPVVSMAAPLVHLRSRSALLGSAPTPEQLVTYSPEQMVSPKTPPFFLAHAENDTNVTVENTLALRAALKNSHVPVETHLFTDGGHGFALRNVKQTNHKWGDLFLTSLNARGL